MSGKPENGTQTPSSGHKASLDQDAVTAWEQDTARVSLADDDLAENGEALLVDVDGYEGPLDLLLALARTQKVDLARISVLQLAEQYLGFIEEARTLRIELAADYLVMAAWLAFLKSRLLLPREEDLGEQLSGEELAQHLAFRLIRLDAMRQAAAQLMARHRLGRDVFARGQHEKVETIKDVVYTADIFDLLKAYTEPRRRTAKRRSHVVKRRPAWSIKDARRKLEELVGVETRTWVQLDKYLVRYLVVPAEARSVLASSFGATLEMAREGMVDIRQDNAFAPLFVRRREDGDRSWDKDGA